MEEADFGQHKYRSNPIDNGCSRGSDQAIRSRALAKVQMLAVAMSLLIPDVK